MRRTMLLAVTALLLAGIAPAQGQAQPYGSPYRRLGVQIPQGVGCYWFRGNLNCSRYCYWEIDGHRYCTRRLRDAHSQAPDMVDGGAAYEPRRRPRPAK
ncbi:MAG: hypothetical protein ABWY63_15275 [Hyphomicrobiaceae bacterium]|jgi:hypothetical protein